MSITYSDLSTTLENLAVDQGPSTDFTQILPQAISYAENRIFRELDFLSTRLTDTSAALTAGSRNATCPSTISVVEGISVLSPAGQTPPQALRVPLERVSLDFIDYSFGAESAVGVPSVYAMKSDTAIVVGISPDSAYKLEITGTHQPASMSASNTTTYLGNNFQELLIAACMIFISGWQKNFGEQGDDPRMAQSWETQYQTLMKSALEFVQRQKSQDPNWSPFSPTPLSTPRS